MIYYVQDCDILKADTEVVAVSVTTANNMKQGLAAQFAKAYPNILDIYEEALAQKKLDIGKVYAVKIEGAPYTIVFFPTSRTESRESKLEYIAQGLNSFTDLVKRQGWKSIAMPKLGTGVGGLEWEDVRDQIVTKLADIVEDASIYIYE